MLKHFIIRNLHSVFGFENYLFLFTVIKIPTLPLDKRKKEYLFFSKLFEKDANIIVIGANTGMTTVPVARNVPGGKVYAIEPVKENYNTLLRVADFFKMKNIIPKQIALGNESKEIEMIMPVINKVKSHGLAHINEQSSEGYDSGVRYKVKMEKLDDLFMKGNERISGIKIVAENYEKFIFEGGKELIQKHKPVIYCELWFNENRLKTLELIRSFGYKVMVLEKGKLTGYNPEVHKTKNFFFMPLK